MKFYCFKENTTLGPSKTAPRASRLRKLCCPQEVLPLQTPPRTWPWRSMDKELLPEPEGPAGGSPRDWWACQLSSLFLCLWQLLGVVFPVLPSYEGGFNGCLPAATSLRLRVMLGEDNLSWVYRSLDHKKHPELKETTNYPMVILS